MVPEPVCRCLCPYLPSISLHACCRLPISSDLEREPYIRPALKREPYIRPALKREPYIRSALKRELYIRPALKREPYIRPALKRESYIRPALKRQPCIRPALKPNSPCGVIPHIGPFKTQCSLYVPPRVTFNNPTFCPHSVFMCFVRISEQTAIFPLHIINSSVFIPESVCLLCGTNWMFKHI